GQLGGEHLALLVANGLSIDHEAYLGVVAKGVKETVAIGRDATGAVDDCVAESASGGRRRQLGELISIDVNVGRGLDFQKIGSGSLYGYRGIRSRDLQRDFHLDRYCAADRDVPRERIEAGCVDFEVIRVGRKIREAERSIGGAHGGLV